MLKDRIALADSMSNYVGKYFSNRYIRKNVLKQTDRDIEDIDIEIEKEGSDTEVLDTKTTKNPEL
jgi:hypothetical protein